MSRDRQPAAVEREDLLVEPHKPPLALADDLRLKAPVPIPRRVDLDLPMLCDQRLRGRAVARVPRPAGRLADAAHSRHGQSARPPSPAPPAAGSTRPTARQARRSPPPCYAPANSPSITSSGIRSPSARLTIDRSLARSTASSISRSPIRDPRCPELDAVAGVSPKGSPPAPPGSETPTHSKNFSFVEGIAISFARAYTVPRTIPAERVIAYLSLNGVSSVLVCRWDRRSGWGSVGALEAGSGVSADAQAYFGARLGLAPGRRHDV